MRITVPHTGGQTLEGRTAAAYLAAAADIQGRVQRSMRAGAGWKRIAALLGVA